MPWVFQEIADNDIRIVLTGMELVLNRLTPAQSATVKTAASDQQDGNARGLVVWFEGAPHPMDLRLMGWTGEQWQTDHDYTWLYTQLVDRLNGLSFEQASQARISLTNSRHYESRVWLFYPTG